MTMLIMKEKMSIEKSIEKYITRAPLYDNQKAWLKKFKDSKESIIPLDGPRQCGRTTIGLGIIFMTAMMHYGARSVFMGNPIMIAHAHAVLVSAFSAVDPECMTTINKSQILLTNSSRILFHKDNANLFRGVSTDLIFVDISAPTMESIDVDLMGAVLPSISHKGKMIVSLG